ncbi:unnamed protein product [Cunninghamella echinulata]
MKIFFYFLLLFLLNLIDLNYIFIYTQKMKDSNLTITLLPEFGWSIHGTPVYGPNSCFSGEIQLKLSKAFKIDRVRLVFQGVESLPPFDVSPGVVRGKKNALFGVQQTLWESKDGSPMLDANTYHYSFTLQLPNVQYPPSVRNDYYACNYKLIAVAELQSQNGSYETLFINEEPVLYMPYVETRPLKQPSLVQQQQQQSDLTVFTKFQSFDYVVGDSIIGSIQVNSFINSNSNQNVSTLMKKSIEVSLRVYQTTKNLLFDDVTGSTCLVAYNNYKLYPVSTTTIDKKKSKLSYSSNIELDLPFDLPPTFTYSSLASMTYKLCINVKRKGPLSMWADEVNMEYPLTMGTLGYGVRSSPDLQVYTLVDKTIVRPTFMKSLEYEDALPVYTSDKLPTYNDVSTTKTLTTLVNPI